jgi:LPPG:FO 2-phospho-L-lactate transferase
VALTYKPTHRLGRVVVLVGGVGGAKLAHGLAQVLEPEQLTVIVNTGDDFWHRGLRVCPDLDTVMYTLAGIVDRTNGWGIAGDTTAMLEALRRYGEDPWFRLGDQDLATHLLRTEAWQRGERLTAITRDLATRLGIGVALLPMSDSVQATVVDTVEHGLLPFQEYFVRYCWQPTVRAIRFESAGDTPAAPTAEARAAIEAADALLIAPSNPWLSIDPILHLDGMRALLLARAIPRVAVSPIVAGRAIKGPAAKLMAELGLAVSSVSIAEYYGTMVNGFVHDVQDGAAAAAALAEHGVRTLQTNTVMTNDTERASLAQQMLGWLAEWSHA